MKKVGEHIVSWCRRLQWSIFVGHAVGETVSYIGYFQCIEYLVGHGDVYISFLVALVNC